MKGPVEARCSVCFITFCCSSCRWNHEQSTHNLKYDCCICRGQRYLCRPEHLANQDFINHLVKEHLPLQCRKCEKVYSTMEELVEIDQCISISELLDKDETKIEAKFDSIFEKANIEGPNFEAIISVNRSAKTAIISPIVRQKHLVDYESSDSDDNENLKVQVVTPHPRLPPKTPKLKKQRAATPHVKKFMTFMRQKVVEEFNAEEGAKTEESPVGNKTTPNRKDEGLVPAPTKEMTTPTSHMNERCLQLGQIVTTSTPTQPAGGGWSMFPEQGTDSPLSEIEGTTGESPAQSIDQDPSKSSEVAPKLKSIIVTGNRLVLGSQDSSEKQVTFQEFASNTDPSVSKAKRVQFAEDTVFETERKTKRVFRKPKRMLTPGPQRPNRFCFNPRFQALINRFESQGITVARTPVNNRESDIHSENTPGVCTQVNKPARAIDFKDDSPVVEEKDTNELFKSCVDSPVVNSGGALNTAISALTNNIAGSLQDCLTTALKPEEEETEIQFKFVITKRKVTVKRLEDGSEGTQVFHENKENIWSSVARAVKNVFWGDQGTNIATTTPMTRSHRSNDSTASSGSKRKLSELDSDSDSSPLSHKRHKYSGRIRGRPPLPRAANAAVALLRSSHSLEHQSLLQEVSSACDDAMNQSF